MKSEQPSGSSTQEIDKGVLFGCESTSVRTGRLVNSCVPVSVGTVVEGWLGRGTTILHCTHRCIPHHHSTRASFLLLFQMVGFVEFLGANLPARTVKLRPKSPRQERCCFFVLSAHDAHLAPSPATIRRMVQDRFAVEGFGVVFISGDAIERRHPLQYTPSLLYPESCPDGNWRHQIRNNLNHFDRLRRFP